MKEVLDMFWDMIYKMDKDNSFVVGSVGGLAVVIPQWIMSARWTKFHTVLILVLAGVLIVDWVVGRKLADKSPITQKNTTVAIDGLIIDFISLFICALCYAVDYLLGTKSIIFTIFTAAFIYHNFCSFVANSILLEWDKNYPMWLFNFVVKWVGDEIEAKSKKYFGTKGADKNK